jgi:hypothetical protein
MWPLAADGGRRWHADKERLFQFRTQLRVSRSIDGSHGAARLEQGCRLRRHVDVTATPVWLLGRHCDALRWALPMLTRCDTRWQAKEKSTRSLPLRRRRARRGRMVRGL